MVDAGWQIARTLPSENRQRRRTLGIADMCGAGFRRIRPSGSTCGVVVRKKEDRVPLDRLFAEHSRVLAQNGVCAKRGFDGVVSKNTKELKTGAPGRFGLEVSSGRPQGADFGHRVSLRQQ